MAQKTVIINGEEVPVIPAKAEEEVTEAVDKERKENLKNSPITESTEEERKAVTDEYLNSLLEDIDV